VWFALAGVGLLMPDILIVAIVMALCVVVGKALVAVANGWE
jgi:hypothetical protein